jgi:hypothetical protein
MNELYYGGGHEMRYSDKKILSEHNFIIFIIAYIYTVFSKQKKRKKISALESIFYYEGWPQSFVPKKNSQILTLKLSGEDASLQNMKRIVFIIYIVT